MSAIKPGSSLRSLVLTPQRIPNFVFLSPRLHRSSPGRTRLLSDHDEESPGANPHKTPLSPAASPRLLLRLPQVRPPPRAAAAESADTDLTTQAAMSLLHVEQVTTPYGFRAVLAASPRTHRRESLFHQNKPVTVTDGNQPDRPPPGSRPDRSRVSLRPVTALGLQVLKELKALSPALRRTRPR